MTHGFSCEGWTDTQKQALALCLKVRLDALSLRDSAGHRPYVDVDTAHIGVYVRRLDKLPPKDKKTAIETVNAAYDGFITENLQGRSGANPPAPPPEPEAQPERLVYLNEPVTMFLDPATLRFDQIDGARLVGGFVEVGPIAAEERVDDFDDDNVPF